MIFPYFQGMVFCAKLANEGGWAAIDDVYRNPPLSTEQILHPEKYRAKPDYPMAIDLAVLKPGDGWKEVGRNVLGEMQMAVLLKKHGARRPPRAGTATATPSSRTRKTGSGWSGSRPGTAKTTPASSLMRMSPIRPRKWATSASRPSPSPTRYGAICDDRLYVVQRRGRDVAVVEGFSAESDAGLDRSSIPGQTDRDEAGRTKQEPPKASSEKPLTLEK